jgi:hypothetical protein
LANGLEFLSMERINLRSNEPTAIAMIASCSDIWQEDNEEREAVGRFRGNEKKVSQKSNVRETIRRIEEEKIERIAKW